MKKIFEKKTNTRGSSVPILSGKTLHLDSSPPAITLCLSHRNKEPLMPLKIGELARLTGCRVVTIRYYEKEGLLRKPERTGTNYRLYDEDDIERLHFIRRCRLHGMNLAEIRDLLAFKDNPSVSCAWIGDLVEKHIADVERQIASLQHLKAHLEALRHTCSGDHGKTCGILDRLDHGDPCPLCGDAECPMNRAGRSSVPERNRHPDR